MKTHFCVIYLLTLCFAVRSLLEHCLTETHVADIQMLCQSNCLFVAKLGNKTSETASIFISSQNLLCKSCEKNSPLNLFYCDTLINNQNEEMIQSSENMIKWHYYCKQFFALMYFFYKASKRKNSDWVMKQWHVNLGDTLCCYNHIITNHHTNHIYQADSNKALHFCPSLL